MIKLLEDNTVLCSDGSNVNSGHLHKTECPTGKGLAAAFVYQPRMIYERPINEVGAVGSITISGGLLTYEKRDVSCDVVQNDVRVPTFTNEETIFVSFLDDLSEHPEKVQQVAKIVFTDEVKAKAQAEIDAKCCQKMVQVPTGEVEEYEEEETYIDTSVNPPVQRTRTVTKERPIMKEVGVVDEDGNPVMEMIH